MSNWLDTEARDDEKARATLLSYFSSECLTHGGYILTVAVGLFAFLQVISYSRQLVTYPAFIIIISVVFGAFLTVSVYFVARTIFWGTLTSMALHVRELTILEMRKETNEEIDRITYIDRIFRACVRQFKEHHFPVFYLGDLNGSSIIVYIIIFVVFSAVFSQLVPIMIR